jgi:chorismate synthase
MESDPEGFSEDAAKLREVIYPRPGHADLAGGMKYNHSDLRNVLERASARETAARVAVGAIAKAFLQRFDVHVMSYVIQIGRSIASKEKYDMDRVELSPVRCPDAEAEKAMINEIDRAKENGDSLGGIVEAVAHGVPVGLGSHVSWDQKLDASLTAAIMSIPAIKGVEIGAGFGVAQIPGSSLHDEILYSPGKGFSRNSNNAGGIEGGISNGEEIVVRAAMKPIPTLRKPLRSVDIHTKEAVLASKERSDVCAVPAAGVVVEAMLSLVLADAIIEKFGGDSMDEILTNLRSYRESLAKWPT